MWDRRGGLGREGRVKEGFLVVRPEEVKGV